MFHHRRSFRRQRRISSDRFSQPKEFIPTVENSRPQNDAPTVITHSFADFGFLPQLQANIAQKGYSTPTPIQDQAIEPILAGRDLIGIAQTGTGKTAAFLLPSIQKIALDPSQKVLVVVPTRELAVQIDEECLSFTRGMRMTSVLAIGGVSMTMQIRKLSRPVQFVIGTPGRLKDLYLSGYLDFSQYQTIVLDEVDRMCDMGFIEDVRKLISKLPTPRQSLFFSATMPGAVSDIVKSFVSDAVTISIRPSQTKTTIAQDFIKLKGRAKVDVLHDLLIQKGFDKVLVFGRTKWGVEKLNKELRQRGFAVDAIHGNKRQNQRQKALTDFRQNTIQILLATDIVSRGIDVSDITHVINYDAPGTYEDYVHRIGRTGRAQQQGAAITFVE